MVRRLGGKAMPLVGGAGCCQQIEKALLQFRNVLRRFKGSHPLHGLPGKEPSDGKHMAQDQSFAHRCPAGSKLARQPPFNQFLAFP